MDQGLSTPLEVASATATAANAAGHAARRLSLAISTNTVPPGRSAGPLRAGDGRWGGGGSGRRLPQAFRSLREHSEGLRAARDDDEQVYDEIPGAPPRFFGAVMRKRNQVADRLMPVYEHPQLLDDLSPELRRRMQGKSCFNFTRLDETLVSELAGLTARARAETAR